MISLFFANPGSGKTTLLCKEVIRAVKQKKYKYIMTNIEVDISEFAPAKVIYVDDIRSILKKQVVVDTLILLDESGLIWSNRDYKSFSADELRFFKLHRHARVDMTLVSQHFNDLDLSIRRLYDKLFLLERTNPIWRYIPIIGSHFMYHVTRVKEITMFIDINEETNKLEEGYKYTRTGFSAFVYDILLGKGWFNRKLYYKYFDSYELPKDVKIYKPHEKYNLHQYRKNKPLMDYFTKPDNKK